MKPKEESPDFNITTAWEKPVTVTLPLSVWYNVVRFTGINAEMIGVAALENEDQAAPYCDDEMFECLNLFVSSAQEAVADVMFEQR